MRAFRGTVSAVVSSFNLVANGWRSVSIGQANILIIDLKLTLPLLPHNWKQVVINRSNINQFKGLFYMHSVFNKCVTRRRLEHTKHMPVIKQTVLRRLPPHLPLAWR